MRGLVPPAVRAFARRPYRQTGFLESQLPRFVVPEQRNAVKRRSSARVAAKRNREAPAKPLSGRRGRGREMGMLEAKSLGVEQCASSGLRIELGENAIEQRLVGHEAL